MRELVTILAEGNGRLEEGTREEWKESDRDAAELLQAVCALANDLDDSHRPGFVVVGIDRSGGACGVDTSDEAQQRIASRLTSTKILPHPSCIVEPGSLQGKDVLVVRVEPYPVPPVVKVDGVAWIRLGTTTRRATEADLGRLNERRPEGHLPFDLRPLPGATLEELDLELLRQEYAARRMGDSDAESFPAFESWLGQRDLARRTDRGWVPNAAGVLGYGLHAQMHFPGAIIEFARFGGTDFDAPVVARKTIAGRLRDQLESLWAQIAAQVVQVPVGATGIRTQYAPQYPLDALKELARNMVQHRLYDATHAPGRVSWFDDRVVFSNPGQPFGRASEGTFGTHSDYRNPTLTSLLVSLGYVERLGRGIRRVRSLLEHDGHPPLEVEVDGFTTVTVRKRP